MSIHPASTKTKRKVQRSKSLYGSSKNDSSCAHHHHAGDELTKALLDPCLTFEEAALQARMQQCHPSKPLIREDFVR